MSQTPPTETVFDNFDEIQAYSCAKGGKQAVLVRELLAGPVPFRFVPTGYVRIPSVRVYSKFDVSQQSWTPLRKRLKAEGFAFKTVWTVDGKEGYIVMSVDKKASSL